MTYKKRTSAYRGPRWSSGRFSCCRRRSSYAADHRRTFQDGYSRESGARGFGGAWNSIASSAGKYGDPIQASFTTIPIPLYGQGLSAGANYLEVPLTGFVDSVLQNAEKTEVYVTGYRLEADVRFSGRLRCFVQSVQTCVKDGEPQVLLSAGSMQGEFDPGQQGLMSMEDPRLRQLSGPLYTRLGNDETLFDAAVKSGAPCRPGVELQKDGGAKKFGTRGRVKMELGRGSFGATTSMETEKLSVYVPAKGLYMMGTDRRDVLLVGLRAKTILNLPNAEVAKGRRIGLLKNVRVIVYMRSKMT